MRTKENKDYILNEIKKILNSEYMDLVLDNVVVENVKIKANKERINLIFDLKNDSLTQEQDKKSYSKDIFPQIKVKNLDFKGVL